MRKSGIFSLLLICFFFSILVIFSNRTVPGFERSNMGYFGKIEKKHLTSDSEIEKTDEATLLFAGDVMLGRSVLIEAVKRGDYNYPFIKISGITKKSDVFYVNLENPIVENCPEIDSGFKFCTRPEMVAGLECAGINVVNLANNHTGNYGTDGITQTENYLNEGNISVAGLKNLVLKKINDIDFGFLGFDFTVKPPSDEDYQLIVDSDGLADYLIISVHWGEEYQSRANNNQRTWARKMIENGADIIVGHHPHWIQDFECINFTDLENNCDIDEKSFDCPCDGISEKPVYYSLGNLVFDQMWSEETKKGLIVKLTIEKDKIIERDLLNTYIISLGQPEIVD